MKTFPIVPARIGVDATGRAFSLDHGNVNNLDADPFVQAAHGFLVGSGLPGRWQGRDRFVVLETGFGLGINFLATWAAWRADPLRSRQLVFISVERHPLTGGDLRRVHRNSPQPELAADLCAAWPPLTPNLHRLVFDGGAVQLLLALGDVAAWLPMLVAEVDAFFLDGFAPERSNPAMWEPRLFKRMGRLAAPGASIAAWTAARAVRDGLGAAGFVVAGAGGTGVGRDITLGRFLPGFMPKRPPARQRVHAQRVPRALVLGAGLAGCAAVAALADQGWQTTLVDRHAGPAQEASGNPAGLFHGVVHAQDGHHARFNRACALEATRAIGQLLDQRAPDASAWGAVCGLLRLERVLPDAAAMRAVLQRLGLPPDHVQALDAADASARVGLPLDSPAWFYPGGGWVRPAALASAWLHAAGAACDFLGGACVEQLQHDGHEWQLLAANGTPIARAPVLVLANASDAARLLDGLHTGPATPWPLMHSRGQLSALPLASHADWPLPQLPLAGAGYLLPPVDGNLIFGATAQTGDTDAAVRASDHRHNLDRLAQLIPTWAGPVSRLSVGELQGRTAWRSAAIDRLPLIGAVPRAWVGGEQGDWDQPRFVPRQAGLYLFSALGSRGITWAPLGAQILAAAVTGAPAPLEAGLIDAIDPARFVTRAARRRSARAVDDPRGGPSVGAT